MPQSLLSLPVHFVFSTKNREPLIGRDWVDELYAVIGGVARAEGMTLAAAGGVANHAHLLVFLGRETDPAKVMAALKGSSSHWAGRRFPRLGFAWQRGYAGFGVGPDGLDAVEAYIAGQEAHHASASFQDEYRGLLARHRIAWDERYVWD